LAGSSPTIKGSADSDVQLIPDEEGDDVRIVPGSSGMLRDSDDSELKLDIAAGSTGTGELEEPDSSSLALGSDLEEEDLSLGDEDDLVLSPSGTGSDVTMGGSDTGINLATPSDSGLSLDDEALDLGSVSSLELPEDEEEVVSLGDDLDEQPVIKKDEEFLLSPADAGVDEDDTSGSQIIELDPTFTEQPLTEEPMDLEEAPLEEVPGTGVVAAPAAYVAAPETPYSAYNVVFLMLITLALLMSGILMFDVVNNMWSWDQDTNQSVASKLMDGIVSAVGLNK
jgi:hypothetical protein